MKHCSLNPTTRSRRGAVRAAFVVGLIGGAFVTSVIVGVVFIWLRLSDDPVYTDETMRDAQLRWTENGPADYDMTIIVTGRQPGEIHVEVRDGQATRVTRDHQQLTVADQMTPWTVPGMFDTVAQDAENAVDAAEGVGDFATKEISQWVSFHQQFGYPQRYHRVIGGTPQEIRWEVTEFHAR